MALVMRRRGQGKKKDETGTDYGFFYPWETIEQLYWERENSNRVVYPDEGGAMDQESPLMDDINTYGWLVNLAGEVLDKEKAARDLIAKQLGNRS